MSSSTSRTGTWGGGGRDSRDAGDGYVADLLDGGMAGRGDRRYLVLSALLWGAAVAGNLIWPDAPPVVWLTLWLPLLIPPFVLGYARGPEGAALGVLAGWLLLAGVGLLAPAFLDRSAHPWLVAAVASVLAAEGAGAAWLVARLGVKASRAVRLAFVDPLTGIPNRRVLEVFLEKEVARARRGRELTVALLGVDRLRRINEELGRGGGDYCLREVAGVLEESTRSMDVLGRWEADRFLVVLSGERSLGGVRCAARLCGSVRDAVPYGGCRLTVSAGVASFASPMVDARDLLEAADRALRDAKSAGGDRVVLNDPCFSSADLGERDVSFWLLEGDAETRHVDAAAERRDADVVSSPRGSVSPGP